MLALVIAVALSQDGGVLEIPYNHQELIDQLGKWPDLTSLAFCCAETRTELPADLRRLTHLKRLVLNEGNGSQMNPQLPEWLGELQELEVLDLYGAQDPRSDSKDKRLTERHTFPKSMSRLNKLVELDLGRNALPEVPAFVRELPHLRKLGLGWNGLKKLPDFIGELKELEELNLAGNDLLDVPRSLDKLPKLKSISFTNNCALTHDAKRMAALKKRFPRAELDFHDMYDCPQDNPAK